MAISAEEQNFNNKVENAPIVQSLKEGQEQIQATLNKEIESNNKRFGQLEDKVQSLEQKVENGFNKISDKIDQLSEVVISNKEEALKAELKKTTEALERKTGNSDKVKNNTIAGLIVTIFTIVLENLGVINVIG